MAKGFRPSVTLSRSFYEAREANAMRLYVGGGRYVDQETLSTLDQAVAPNLPDLLGRWERTIRNADPGGAEQFSDEIFETVLPRHLSPFQGRWLVLDLVNILRRVALERHLGWDELAGGSEPVEVLDKAESAEEWRAWLLELTAAYMTLAQSRPPSATVHVVQKALAYIQANYTRDLSLQEVAEHAGVCKSYLSRVFPEHIGENYRGYLQYLRIDRAKELLRLSDTRVHEIAGMVGFWNVRYFSRVFRENVGMTPADYRRLPMEADDSRS
jgi:AraC-like DNA-binding protein